MKTFKIENINDFIKNIENNTIKKNDVIVGYIDDSKYLSTYKRTKKYFL